MWSFPQSHREEATHHMWRPAHVRHCARSLASADSPTESRYLSYPAPENPLNPTILQDQRETSQQALGIPAVDHRASHSL